MENNQDFVTMKVAEAQKVFTFKREEGNIIINSYKGKDAEIVIPQIIGKSPVTGINKCAFQSHPDLTSVDIPEGVMKIGSYAFRGCTGLTSVSIPESVRLVDLGAFDGCTSLQSVTIPNGMKLILSRAFCYCTSLASITIPASVTDFGPCVFEGCKALTIHAPAGSAAEEYAKKYGIKFEALAE